MKISSSEHLFFFHPVQGPEASQGRWLLNGEENAGYKDIYDR